MLTLIDDDRALEVPVRVAHGRARVPWAVVAAALHLDRPAGSEEVDLAELAGTLDRPLALDLEEGAAYLGVSAARRSAALRSLVAPAFELSDLDGRRHSLSAQQGKKVLLVAYASW